MLWNILLWGILQVVLLLVVEVLKFVKTDFHMYKTEDFQGYLFFFLNRFTKKKATILGILWFLAYSELCKSHYNRFQHKKKRHGQSQQLISIPLTPAPGNY